MNPEQSSKFSNWIFTY